MCSLLAERLLHLFQVEAQRTADLVEGNPAPPRQPPDGGGVNAEGARQGGGVHQAGVLSRAEGILRIRTIGPAEWDEPGQARGHGSHLWALMSDSI
jgi:hypothetical protein